MMARLCLVLIAVLHLSRVWGNNSHSEQRAQSHENRHHAQTKCDDVFRHFIGSNIGGVILVPHHRTHGMWTYLPISGRHFSSRSLFVSGKVIKKRIRSIFSMHYVLSWLSCRTTFRCFWKVIKEMIRAHGWPHQSPVIREGVPLPLPTLAILAGWGDHCQK